MSNEVNPSIPNGAIVPNEAQDLSTGPATKSANKPSSKQPAKAQPDNLEKLIEAIYARKGAKVALNPKVLAAIAKNLNLDSEAWSGLESVVAQDTVLAVPRQLLLVAEECEQFPMLKRSLKQFAFDVFSAHPMFRVPEVADVISNRSTSATHQSAIRKIQKYLPEETAAEVMPDPQQNPKSKSKVLSKDILDLRSNGINLLVTWLAIDQNMRPADIAAILLETVWSPELARVKSIPDRIRLLTEVKNAASVGLAAQEFQTQAEHAIAGKREADRLLSREIAKSADLGDKLSEADAERNRLGHELRDLQVSSAEELKQLKSEHDAQVTHLLNDIEQMRGRLSTELDSCVSLLRQGLSALGRTEPNVQVMSERADSVARRLERQLDELKGEDQ